MASAERDDVLEAPEAAQLLHLGRNALYDACARGEIPHQRIGKVLRFSRAALMKWLAGELRFTPCGRSQVARKGRQ